MATKSNTSVVSKPEGNKATAGKQHVLVIATEEDDRPKMLAETSLRPDVNAASTLLRYQSFTGDELDICQLVKALRVQADRAAGSKFERGEEMLAMQAHTLDALFNVLAQRAANNIGTYPQTVERYLRLALKAQSQCRVTIEALAEIKNPRPVAFVRQANIANGPQQVNNGGQASPSRTEKNESAPNKLLEAEHGERLDIGEASAAGGVNSQLEAVGAVNGTDDDGRESANGKECI